MPGLFEQFPHTNLHELNLDWMIELLNQFKQELEDRAVISVNGMTGEVTLYESENVVLPPLTNASSWRLVRMMDGQYVGVLFQDGHVWLQQGNSTLKLLTTEDIPSSVGVVSINGMGGIVRITGRDIPISDDPDADSIRLALETEQRNRMYADEDIRTWATRFVCVISDEQRPNDANLCNTPGLWYVNPSASNKPTVNAYYLIFVLYQSENNFSQTAINIDTGETYTRTFHDGSTWSDWRKNITDADYFTSEISATTDATGDINLSIPTSQYIPIMFTITGGNMRPTCPRIFMQSTTGDLWWLKFISDQTDTNVANTTVVGTLYYKRI